MEHPLDILREELQQTNVALKCAYDKFNYVTEPELIEASIYEISALKARYSYLLRCIRSRNRRPAPGADGITRRRGGLRRKEGLYVRCRDRRTVRGGAFCCSPPCACSGGR